MKTKSNSNCNNVSQQRQSILNKHQQTRKLTPASPASLFQILSPAALDEKGTTVRFSFPMVARCGRPHTGLPGRRWRTVWSVSSYLPHSASISMHFARGDFLLLSKRNVGWKRYRIAIEPRIAIEIHPLISRDRMEA